MLWSLSDHPRTEALLKDSLSRGVSMTSRGILL